MWRSRFLRRHHIGVRIFGYIRLSLEKPLDPADRLADSATPLVTHHLVPCCNRITPGGRPYRLRATRPREPAIVLQTTTPQPAETSAGKASRRGRLHILLRARLGSL